MKTQDHSPAVLRADKSYLPLGVFCIILGVGAVIIAWDYPYGTLTEMGPGFIPTTVAGLLTLMGIVILALRGQDVDAQEVDEAADASHSLSGLLRAMFMILGSIVLFGITLHPLGLAISTFLLVMIASYARRDAELLPSIVLAVCLSASSCVLFVVLLGVNASIFPEFL